MKGIIGRVFPRKDDPLAGGGVPNHSALSSVEIGIRRSGTGPKCFVAFAAYIRILRWDPIMPVLLQNLPVIDGKIRKVVAASVILEHTHFEGLWFQAQCTTEGAPEDLVGMPAELLRHPRPA